MKDYNKALEAYEYLSLLGTSMSSMSWAICTCRRREREGRAEFEGELQTDPKNIRALWRSGVVR